MVRSTDEPDPDHETQDARRKTFMVGMVPTVFYGNRCPLLSAGLKWIIVLDQARMSRVVSE